MNKFEKYLFYKKENGIIVNVNKDSLLTKAESFELFKKLYDTTYGSIEEDDNLISIHTGGWSYNEGLIEQFKETCWWIMSSKIEAPGGHYYINSDFSSDRVWEIIKKNK